MTRPLRLQFPGALYHVTARGDRRLAIYGDELDRVRWLDILGHVCHRHHFIVYSYCQMSNHFHLLVETPEANLARGMQHLNGAYTRHFNRRHGLAGHLFQGRYHAVLVQKQRYLLALCRYIALNPLRAGMVEAAEQWPWSSHALLLRRLPCPPWLDSGWLLSQFDGIGSAALQRYAEFVRGGVGLPSPLYDTRHQVLLGDEGFVASYRKPDRAQQCREIVREQRRALALSLEEYQARFATRQEAIAQAYRSTAYSMREIASHFGVSYRTVSRIVAKHDA
ncbi:transposase [Oxalobacteraceae bacterium A2-2]